MLHNFMPPNKLQNAANFKCLYIVPIQPLAVT